VAFCARRSGIYLGAHIRSRLTGLNDRPQGGGAKNLLKQIGGRSPTSTMFANITCVTSWPFSRKDHMTGSTIRICRFVLLLSVCQGVSAAQTSGPPDAQPNLPAQYSATAFGQSGSAAGKTFGMTIYVQELTSDGDTAELVAVLKNKGQDGLVSAMENIKDKGRVSPSGSVGTGMRVVRIRPTKDGGQHTVLATNRPISFPELYNSTRSTSYKISIVTLDVDKDGNGTGSFAPLCKVKFNKKNELEIEHYGQKPFRLANVSRQK
jgi:hypothetical protein